MIKTMTDEESLQWFGVPWAERKAFLLREFPNLTFEEDEQALWELWGCTREEGIAFLRKIYEDTAKERPLGYPMVFFPDGEQTSRIKHVFRDAAAEKPLDVDLWDKEESLDEEDRD